MRSHLIFTGLALMCATLVASTASRQAHAEVVHRYNFNGDVNDSVGTAHGLLIDAGTLTSATFTGGQLDLSGNVGNGSNNIVEDAYVDLPDDIISAAASTNGALTFELWATVSQTRTWQRIVDFGSSNNGEDTSDGAQTVNYLYISPNHGRFNNGLATEVHQPDTAFEVGLTGPLQNNRQFHIVGTYDHNDTTAGANGTTKLYLDGTLLGSVALAPNVDLRTIVNHNNWIGRSQWPDPLFDGLINEFRIYNTAMTQAEVIQDVTFGPDVLNPGGTISLTVNKSTGAVSFTNSANAPLALDFYSITSVQGALSLANWNSLDDQNYDAVDGPDAGTVAGNSLGEGWDQAGGSTNNQLVEHFLGEAGSTIGPGETVSLGNAYNTSIFGALDGDLLFNFGVNNGALIPATVTYVTGGQPGDFDSDGDVDGRDFLVWQRGGSPSPLSSGDLTLWRNNYGSGTLTASASAVPEPGTALLLVAVSTLVAAGRRQVHCV